MVYERMRIVYCEEMLEDWLMGVIMVNSVKFQM